MREAKKVFNFVGSVSLLQMKTVLAQKHFQTNTASPILRGSYGILSECRYLCHRIQVIKMTQRTGTKHTAIPPNT